MGPVGPHPHSREPRSPFGPVGPQVSDRFCGYPEGPVEVGPLTFSLWIVGDAGIWDGDTV
jgi:hypothetical protein